MFFRFGLLTLYAAFLMIMLLSVLHAPVNLTAWYANSILFALGAMLAQSLYAFRTALGGQKLFKEKLLEE